MKTYPLSSALLGASDPSITGLFKVHYKGGSVEYPFMLALYVATLYYNRKAYFNITSNDDSVLEYEGGTDLSGVTFIVNSFRQLLDIISTERGLIIAKTPTSEVTPSKDTSSRLQDSEQPPSSLTDEDISAEYSDSATLNDAEPKESQADLSNDRPSDPVLADPTIQPVIDQIAEEKAHAINIDQDKLSEPIDELDNIEPSIALEPELVLSEKLPIAALVADNVVDVEFKDVDRSSTPKGSRRPPAVAPRDNRKALDLGILK